MLIPKFHMNEILQYVWLLLMIMFLRFLYVVYVVHSFLLLNTIISYGYAIICISIFLLTDFHIVLIFGYYK